MSSSVQPKLFGTDGIRGEFGRYPLDQQTLRRLARSLAEVVLESHDDRTNASVVLGGDTRSSTPTITQWIAAELEQAGVTCIPIGTAPTPAIAWAVRETRAQCGVAISASHNPHRDNGVKLFDSNGFKWTTTAEVHLEQRMKGESRSTNQNHHQATPSPPRQLRENYLLHLQTMVSSQPRPLAGLDLAIDAANGAAAPFAQRLFEQLGASVTVISDRPDGRNINENCGSTHPEKIAELTVASSAQLGVSFDGDADRVIVSDETGAIQDGDAILYLWARHLAQHGRLPGMKVVATSMSNIGLERALSRLDIELVRCEVGDRAVVETMVRNEIVLGGEQSGHIVHLDSGTTGDGIATALQIASLVAAGGPLSTMLDEFVRYPQLIKNVPVSHKPPLQTIPSIVAHQRAVEDELGSRGRLVLRYSGTEDLVRIMIEGEDSSTIEQLANQLAITLEAELST